MNLWFCVYTNDPSAAADAFVVAHEDNAKDIVLKSEHSWRTKKLECFELRFLADRQSRVADFIEQGPFAARPEDLSSL